MIKAVNSFDFNGKMSKVPSEQIYRRGIINFSDGSGIYIKDTEKGDPTNQIDEISELSNEDIKYVNLNLCLKTIISYMIY